ncbi:MAG: NEW3 domain-containing protein [Candidatus Bathyarchaeota archaeon]|nr:NEW3 domain-containing protein [Candidatus Bathyarchaeota archaeon]
MSLSASVVKRLTTPGNTLTLSFSITNGGDETEDVVFTVDAPSGWSTKIMDNVGEIENILLDHGTESYSIEINVPETATSIETVMITAEGSSVDTLSFTITPKVYTDEIELKSTYLSVSEELGQSFSLPLTVTNHGEVDKKVSLYADIPDGWSIVFKTSSSMAVKTLLMEASATEQLTIALEAPDTVSVGDYGVVVSALDVNEAVLDTLELDVNLREGVSEIEVISSFSEVSVDAGESITFPLAIWNQGEADALVLLTAPTLPENWDASFIADELKVASIRIGSGESESIQLIVDPPSSVASGTYEMVVLIESDDGGQHSLDFTIEVGGSFELALDLSTLYTSGKIGDTVSYTAKVTNEGQTAITTLYVEADVPDDWEATISPTQVDTLSPRSSTTFTVTVEIPSDAEAGDYLVTMQALSDQLDSDESDVRITAQASNTWGYIGLGIAAVAIGGAALLFKRFKRR